MTEHSSNNQPPSSLQPSPFDGNLKWKMFTLIGMLLAVLYAMNEAGKPENWAWMGFDKAVNSVKNEKPSPPAAPTAEANTNSDATDPSSEATNDSTSALTPNATPPLKTKAIRLSENTLRPMTSQQTSLPTESGKFWTSFFTGLKTAEQIEWMELLDVLQSNQSPAQRPQVSQTQSQLITRFEQRRDVFNNTLLDHMSTLPNASKKRSKVSQDYFEANKFWQKQISPALTALLNAEDLTLLQQQAALKLQRHLDAESLNMIQDKTAVGWTGDSVAWNRCWNRIHQSGIVEPTFVKRIQLIAQPQAFRGQAITVNGFVRDIETRRAARDSSIMGTESDDPDERIYYVLWIQPSESDAGPYCVFCLQPPAELPRSRDELANYHWIASIDGIFFKNRSYVASDETVQHCPLILAADFSLKPPISDHPALKWKPSRGLMTGLLAMIPLLAVGVVWYTVRSTVSRKRLPSKKSEEETNVFLDDLKNDPSIKTELEQIQAIAEHEDDIE